MQSIIEINEDAILLIENGNYDSAVDMLDIAMDQLHSSSESSESESNSSDLEEEPLLSTQKHQEDISVVQRQRQESSKNASTISSSLLLDECDNVQEHQQQSLRNKKSQEDFDNTVSSSLKSTSSSSTSSSTITITRIIYVNNNQNGCGDIHGDFIWTSPIRYCEIEDDEECCDDYDQQEEVVVVVNEMTMGAILMFNMALSYHLRALKVSSSSSEDDRKKNNKKSSDLKCALKLYQLCFRLILEEDETEYNITTEQMLALTNNCGQIYMALNRPTKAKQFFTHMFTTLSVMIEDGSAQELDNLHGFMWNASKFILGKEKALAPAA